jgi:uncharacterized protein DUF4440
MSMEISDVMKESLEKLNRQIAHEEQRGEAASMFLKTCLSDQLIFRRANGKVVGKEKFLEELKNNPFLTRVAEMIEVNLLEDRALVTLIVVGTRADDGSVHYYRNIRLFTRSADQWLLEFWYNFEITGL